MTEALLVLAAIPLAWFMYRYARHSPWRSTLQGRALMAQKGATLALVLLILARHVFGQQPWITWALAVLAMVLVVMFWVMLIGLLKAQNARFPSLRGRGYRPETTTTEKKEHK